MDDSARNEIKAMGGNFTAALGPCRCHALLLLRATDPMRSSTKASSLKMWGQGPPDERRLTPTLLEAGFL